MALLFSLSIISVLNRRFPNYLKRSGNNINMLCYQHGGFDERSNALELFKSNPIPDFPDFQHEIDRDIAVMLECGEVNGKFPYIGDLLPKQDKPYEKATFQLPGVSISAHKSAGSIKVNSLEDLKAHVQFKAGHFEFGAAWIEHFGQMA